MASTTYRALGVLAFALAATAAGALVGCAPIGKVRPVALYPDPQHPRPAETVALLQGPIRAVDGLDVEARGTAFQVLPGCHVVVLKPKIGAGSELGAWSADLGLVTYAFRMTPGRAYSIEPEASFGSAGHGTVKLFAYERNPDGSVAGTFAPVRGQAEVEACQAWATAQGFRPFPLGSEPADATPRANAMSSFAK